MASKEIKTVNQLFQKLCERPQDKFPAAGLPQVTTGKAVYIIRSSRGLVLHVGETPRGVNGLRYRLKNHLRGQSSFVRKYFNGHGAGLRQGCTYQYLEIRNNRTRSLVNIWLLVCFAPRILALISPRASARLISSFSKVA
jgi:hypothetical protein